MAFHLRRLRDGAGDSGQRSEAIVWNEDGTFKEVVSHKPTIGCSMCVGSLFARTYSNDYWLTTQVTEIIEEIENDDVNYIKFKTGNSVYEWWNGVHPYMNESEENDNKPEN